MKWRKRLHYNKKRTFSYLFLFLLLFGVTVGYAFLTSNLGIDGIIDITKSTWDVHFANINPATGSVEATTNPEISNNTTVQFATTLEKPGDFYEFEIDIVNAGTYDAKIDGITLTPELTTNQQEYFNYTVTYNDGVEIKQNDALDAGTTETIKVHFEYLNKEDKSLYPEEDTNFEFQVTINYIQGKGNAVNHPIALYNVLKTAAEEGTYAKEYTGAHHDSFTEAPSKKIYHWHADNSTEGTEILDKNNVIFAGQCWQMIRTTDTGGVKMIYNGEAENNQCLNTRGTHVGYAERTSQNLASNYWYGTDYTYDSANKTFKVSGTTEQTTWNATTGPGLVGKYTCKNASEDATCATLYLVESYYNASSAYVIPLNSNSHYSQFGKLQFNESSNSPADVGYMYNTRYTLNSKAMTSSENILSSTSLGTTYWYADSATWGSPTANKYNLDSPYQVSATTDYPNLVGEYTFRNATQTYTNTSVYYIAAVNNTTMYYIQLGNESGSTHDLSFYNYTYTYGDSYIDNGDGTYTINNPTTIERKDWYTSYSNLKNKYVCKNAVNNTCSELWYTIATSNTSMTYIPVANNYKYANGFTWDGSKYVLDNDTSVNFWNINDSANKISLNNAHYTCWNTTGECTSISYIYYLNGTTLYYINITNGKSVEDAVNEMLYNNDVNTINSTIKSGIDAWYKHYLLEDYDDYIEDTIFCNDRSQSNANTNGWNPNGGSIYTEMRFKEYNATSDLSCTNTTDKFSVSNNNAKLTYKVGLMASPEMNLLNNVNVRKTGQIYLLGSPNYFGYSVAYVRYVSATGNVYSSSVDGIIGVRPSVSLTTGTKYSDGDGSMANPYVIE